MKYLVAVDGSQASTMAVERAIALAAPTQSAIVLLNVVETAAMLYPKVMMPTGDWVSLQGLPDPALEEKLIASGEAVLQQAAQQCEAAGIACETRLELGAARETICAIAKAENVDLVVLGSRGLGTVERLMLGSVSDYVVHHAPCPVMVVR